MERAYKNRQMKTEDDNSSGSTGTAFFLPKNNPPVTIWAESKAEAEEKLKVINKKV